MKTQILRHRLALWPVALLTAMALHSSGRAEAPAGLSAYATPVQKLSLIHI